jgi:hypothetical protein
MKFTLNLQLHIKGIKSCRKALICAIVYGTRIHPLTATSSFFGSNDRSTRYHKDYVNLQVLSLSVRLTASLRII